MKRHAVTIADLGTVFQPEFDGKETEEHYLSLPASVNLNALIAQGTHIEDAMLVISGSELRRRVFDPVVKNVVSYSSMTI